MKYVTCFLLLIIATSCNYFDKRKVNADDLLTEDLKTVNWNDVDEYPVFESCSKASSKQERKVCFESTLTTLISNKLSQQEIIVTEELNDTIVIEFSISEVGFLEISSMKISDEVVKQIPTITDLLQKSVDSLPKIHPAIKRGQQVKTQFELPIILYVN